MRAPRPGVGRDAGPTRSRASPGLPARAGARPRRARRRASAPSGPLRRAGARAGWCARITGAAPVGRRHFADQRARRGGALGVVERDVVAGGRMRSDVRRPRTAAQRVERVHAGREAERGRAPAAPAQAVPARRAAAPGRIPTMPERRLAAPGGAARQRRSARPASAAPTRVQRGDEHRGPEAPRAGWPGRTSSEENQTGSPFDVGVDTARSPARALRRRPVRRRSRRGRHQPRVALGAMRSRAPRRSRHVAGELQTARAARRESGLRGPSRSSSSTPARARVGSAPRRSAGRSLRGRGVERAGRRAPPPRASTQPTKPRCAGRAARRSPLPGAAHASSPSARRGRSASAPPASAAGRASALEQREQRVGDHHVDGLAAGRTRRRGHRGGERRAALGPRTSAESSGASGSGRSS